MFCKLCIEAGLSNALMSGWDNGCSLEPDYGVPQGGVPKFNNPGNISTESSCAHIRLWKGI